MAVFKARELVRQHLLPENGPPSSNLELTLGTKALRAEGQGEKVQSVLLG